MSLQLWEILVPTVRRSNKKPYRTRFHKVWDSKVRDIAGGLTILKPAKGEWVSTTGELHQERMIPVRIRCTRKQMEAIVTMSLDYYDQLAIFWYRLSEESYITDRAGTKTEE